MSKENNNPLNLAATVIRQGIMKFYTYKNGEIAFFENNEKMLITKEEYDILVEGRDVFDGSAIFSDVETYISKKIDSSVFSKVLEEYRSNTYTIEEINVKANGKEIPTILYKENGSIIAIEVVLGGNKRSSYKGRSDFDRTIAQMKSLGIA